MVMQFSKDGTFEHGCFASLRPNAHAVDGFGELIAGTNKKTRRDCGENGTFEHGCFATLSSFSASLPQNLPVPPLLAVDEFANSLLRPIKKRDAIASRFFIGARNGT